MLTQKKKKKKRPINFLGLSWKIMLEKQLKIELNF